MYKLRTGQPPIECVDGPLAGRTFEPGREYAEIPENERHRFETIRPPATRSEPVRLPKKRDPDPVTPSEDAKQEE